MDENKIRKAQENDAQIADPAQNAPQTGESAAQTAAAPAAGVTAGTQYKPPTLPENSYTSPYDGQLRELYRSITERKPFSYDASDDAMYQQYRDRYMQLGQQAMRDTTGQAAALTGGYGSSYGEAVGQQQYNRYMLGLNDKANELYQAAYGRWQDEGEAARRDYAMLQDQAERDYERWADAYSRDMQRYGLGLDEAAQRAQFGDMSGIAAVYGDDAAAGARWQYAYANPDAAYRSGVITADDYFNITGMYPAGYEGGMAGYSGGGGGAWTGVDYDNRGVPMSAAAQAQRMLGVKDDGLIGSQTRAALNDYTGDNPYILNLRDYYNNN